MNGIELVAQTQSDGKRSIWKTLGILASYLWEFRWRIGIALFFLILAKVAIILVPITIKEIVDWFDASLHPESILVVPILLIATYGLLRLASTLFEEIRNALFSRASQRAVRNVGLKVFQHLHQLSHSFHQNRSTGGISRDIERGTRGINSLLWYIVFSIFSYSI